MSFWINTMKCQNCGTEVNVSGGMVGTQSMGPATLECAKPGCGNKGFENFVNLGPVKVPQVVFEAADSTDVLELKAKLEVAESLLDAYIKNEIKTKAELESSYLINHSMAKTNQENIDGIKKLHEVEIKNAGYTIHTLMSERDQISNHWIATKGLLKEAMELLKLRGLSSALSACDCSGCGTSSDEQNICDNCRRYKALKEATINI
jgi:hypothetical protein